MHRERAGRESDNGPGRQGKGEMPTGWEVRGEERWTRRWSDAWPTAYARSALGDDAGTRGKSAPAWRTPAVRHKGLRRAASSDAHGFCPLYAARNERLGADAGPWTLDQCALPLSENGRHVRCVALGSHASCAPSHWAVASWLGLTCRPPFPVHVQMRDLFFGRFFFLVPPAVEPGTEISRIDKARRQHHVQITQLSTKPPRPSRGIDGSLAAAHARVHALGAPLSLQRRTTEATRQRRPRDCQPSWPSEAGPH